MSHRHPASRGRLALRIGGVAFLVLGLIIWVLAAWLAFVLEAEPGSITTTLAGSFALTGGIAVLAGLLLMAVGRLGGRHARP